MSKHLHQIFAPTRRGILAAMGTGLAPLTITTAWGQASPAKAREKRVPLRNLGAAEGTTLEAFGDTLLPGAGKAGIANYVDRSDFAALTAPRKTALVRELSQSNPEGWTGPPAPLFYFVVRNDAVDVYYSAREGFERLAVPYMAYILPPEKW